MQEEILLASGNQQQIVRIFQAVRIRENGHHALSVAQASDAYVAMLGAIEANERPDITARSLRPERQHSGQQAHMEANGQGYELARGCHRKEVTPGYHDVSHE